MVPFALLITLNYLVFRRLVIRREEMEKLRGKIYYIAKILSHLGKKIAENGSMIHSHFHVFRVF